MEVATENPLNAYFDKETSKWAKEHPSVQFTVTQCEFCKLWYKPMLGHKCNGVKDVKHE